MATSPTRQYVYPTEISSMVYVFTGIGQADEELVHCLEDVVRAQIVELVTHARAQASRRGARTVSVEDLLFLVRNDRAKVNRLRSYLSWKDARKRAMEQPEADDELDEMEEPVSDKALKVVKAKVRLPWELADQWADYLRGEDEPEDDEAEAYEVNKQRLKEAEEITRNMSREEYEQWAQARSASFVYRKGKKFRDFIPTLDALSPTDEVLDVLGFLSYECIRTLCEAGLTNKRSVTAAQARVEELEDKREAKRKRETGEDGDGAEAMTSPAREGASPSKEPLISPEKKRARKTGEATSAAVAAAAAERSPPNKPLEVPTSLFSAPVVEPAVGPALPATATFGAGIASETSEALLLQLQDVTQGFQAVQHSQQALKTNGMRNWRGGIGRLSNRLV